MKIKYRIRNLKYNIGYPYRVIRNYFLTKRYPWLFPYNVWTGEPDNDYKYDYLMIEPDENGWMKAFFYQMMEEIRAACIKADYLTKLRTIQFKSKYGEMRWYTNGAPQEVDNIINKYSCLSRNICEYCGCPDVGYTTGWITPVCKRCYDAKLHMSVNYEEGTVEPRTMQDYRTYKNGESEKITIDILKEANEIRRRWNKKHPFRTVKIRTEEDAKMAELWEKNEEQECP